MKRKLMYSLFGTAMAVSGGLAALTGGGDTPARASTGETAHSFEFTAIEGGPLPLSQFSGKAVLVVNTASLCGFTHQYEGLQALWERYRDQGLVVIGVPSNDFGNQEPGTGDEIKEFCEGTYAIDFPLTRKEHVKGREAHPFYRWARDVLGSAKAPRWNFHKYLIGPDGALVDGFATTVAPDSPELTRQVEAVLPNG